MADSGGGRPGRLRRCACSRTTSIGPKVLGQAVGLTPLIILITVAAVGLLFGGFTCSSRRRSSRCFATIIDVLVFEKDPAKEEVPR